MYDILIKNGKIVDGSGESSFYGDIAVKAGKIAKIAPHIIEDAIQTIDATGLVVTPGFIDCHSHSDGFVLEGSDCYNFLEQGITTQITGHCGSSPAPYYKGALVRQKSYLPVDRYEEMVESVQSVHSFMQKMEQVSIGCNMAFFVGHSNLRAKVMGFSPEKATQKQMQAMQDELCQAMDAGCLGFSTGLIYAPSAYADTEELIELAKVMVPYHGIYATHIRNERNDVVRSVEEAIRIGQEAGVQVHLSHLKVIGIHNEGLSEQLVKMIDEANRKGVTVYADQYPYHAGSSPVRSLIPPEYHAGGIDALLQRLEDPAVRNTLETKVLEKNKPDRILLSGMQQTPQWNHMTVMQLAQELSLTPIDAFCTALIENHGVVQGIFFNQSESDMLRILAHPKVFAGSDSANFPDNRFDPESVGGRHPRGQAAIVRRLSMQRDLGLCTLEESIKRVTSGPANALRLARKGLLEVGYDADITIFDYNNLRDHATFHQPYKENEGIKCVLVNGVVAVDNGKTTNVRAGKILKREK